MTTLNLAYLRSHNPIQAPVKGKQVPCKQEGGSSHSDALLSHTLCSSTVLTLLCHSGELAWLQIQASGGGEHVLGTSDPQGLPS